MTGKFQCRMSVQSLATVEDGFGSGAPDDWQEVRAEMFFLQPLRGQEYIAAQMTQSNTTHKGMCHYFAGANSKMRLKYGDRIFHVDGVVNRFERNAFLDWQLVEVKNG